MTPQHAVTPPDGGWGWVIVGGCALQWFFLGALLKSFSLIHEQMRIHYGTSASAAAAVYSFNIASCLLTGTIINFLRHPNFLFLTAPTIGGQVVIPSIAPLSAALSTRVSARQGGLIGTALMFTGTLATAFAPSIVVVYFTYGIMAGTGAGLIGTMKLINIPLWFRKKLGRAISLSVMTDGLGAIALSPLLDFMFGYYGYTGTMMFISALSLHGLVVAMVLIPPPCPCPQKSKLEVEVEVKDFIEQSHTSYNKDEEFSRKTPQSLRSRICSSASRDDDNEEWAVSFVDGIRRSSTSKASCSIPRSTTKISTEDDVAEQWALYELATTNHTASSSDDIGKNDQFKTAQIAANNLSHLRNGSEAVQDGSHQWVTEKLPESSLSNLQNYRSDAEWVPEEPLTRCGGCIIKFYSYLDIRLLRSTSFFAFSLMMTSSSLCSSMSNTHLAGMAIDRSIASHQVAILLTIVGALAVLTKVFSGFVFDLCCFKAIRTPVFATLGVVSGLILICIPLTSGPPMFYFMWILNVVVTSTISTQESVVLNDLVPRKGFTSAVGLSRFFRGLGVMIGPTVGGLLKDKTGDYNSTFYFGGSIFFLSAIIFEINVLRKHLGLCKRTIKT